MMQQVRCAGKRSRTGRLQHHRFGTAKVRGRYYYRFHKMIGKANWRKYTERFIAPRAIENRLRFIPTPYADYTVARASKSWLWRLPKALAAATTPDAVLETWIRFRHKGPKKTYHFFKVLKRLVDVGGMDASDWRVKFITARMHKRHMKVLNLPRLAKYYAALRVTNEMEHLSRFMHPMLQKYKPQQLVLVAQSFGAAKLQDKHLLAEVARCLEQKLDAVSPTDLVRTARGFAAVEMCHYTLLGSISAQVQVRVEKESQGQAPPGTTPSFSQLADLAEAFSALKFQDYSYFELCSTQAQHFLLAGAPGPTPPALARLCTATARLKIHDVRLFEIVLAHVDKHWYDYPALCLAEIGVAVAPVLPRSEAMLNVYAKMFNVMRGDQDLLTLRGVDLAARFMAEVDHKEELAPDFARMLKRRLLELRNDTRERYDVARVTEIFARRYPDDRALFSCLCRHLHRHLGVFEPVDFVRFARGLARAEYRDERAVHALAKWAEKRLAEFSAFDWDKFCDSLEALGASPARLSHLREGGRPAIQSSMPVVD